MNRSIYAILTSKFGRPAAFILTVIWFTIILVSIGYFSFEPQAELKYLAL